MPFVGNAFNRLYSWVTDRNNNVKIRADRMDAEFDGIATGLTQTITRGIPLTTAGTSTAYTATSIQSFTNANVYDGATIRIRPHTASGATPTIAVDGMSARAIRRQDGLQIGANELVANSTYTLTYRAADTSWYVQGAALPIITGNALRVLRVNAAGTALEFGAGVPSLVRSARTSNTILASADWGTFIDVTTGGFTQTFTAAATLTNGWWCYIRNASTSAVEVESPAAVSTTSTTSIDVTSGTTWTAGTALSISTGDLVIVRRTADPLNTRVVGTVSSYNSGTGQLVVTVGYRIGSGTYTDWTITTRPNTAGIDGLASYLMYPGEVRLFQCDGTAFRTFVITPFITTFTASGVFVTPPGYSAFAGLQWAGGGSGGRSGTSSFVAGGGGGGACVPFIRQRNEFADASTVTIGAGGAGRTTTGDGNAGGNSTFTLLSGSQTAFGGGGGGGSAATDGGGGGGGGSISAGLTGSGGSGAGGRPQIHLSISGIAYGGTGGGRGGFSSGTATTGGDADYGGGGGGASGLTNGTGGSSLYGGGGGGGVSSSGGGSGGASTYGGGGGAAGTSASGTAGTAPGGGGGGTQTGTSSGAGARGELRIWGVV